MNSASLVIGSFHGKYIPEPNSGCWLWTAGVGIGGYGRLWCGAGLTRYAHRFSYELAFGPVPSGMFVCHRCDTPACVNPDHLFLGTHRDNMRDMQQKGRVQNAWTRGTLRRPERCPEGHEFTPENTYVRRNGARKCKACSREYRKAWGRRCTVVESQATTEVAI